MKLKKHCRKMTDAASIIFSSICISSSTRGDKRDASQHGVRTGVDCGSREGLGLGLVLPNDLTFVVAPMINQSDAPFRALCLRHGATSAYTEMFYSNMLADCYDADDDVDGGGGGGNIAGLGLAIPPPKSSHYAATAATAHVPVSTITSPSSVSAISYLDMKLPAIDHTLPQFTNCSRPLIAQVCGNDPSTLAKAAKVLCKSGRIDAIDLNLGCPQEVAKINMFGSYLLDKHLWPLVFRCVASMSEVMAAYNIPLLCKIRIIEGCNDEERFANTVAFCEGLVANGARAITVHGRLRGSPRHRRSGPADVKMIDRIAACLPVPVVSNGNIVRPADISRQIDESTHVIGYMSAEGVLMDPAVFSKVNSTSLRARQQEVPILSSRESLEDSSSSSTSCSISSSTCSSGSSNSSNITNRSDRNALFQEYCDLMDAYVKGGGFQGELPSPHEKMMYTARQHLTWMLEKVGHGRSVRFLNLGDHFKKHFQLLTAVNESQNLDDLRAVSEKCLRNVFESTEYDPSKEDS